MLGQEVVDVVLVRTQYIYYPFVRADIGDIAHCDRVILYKVGLPLHCSLQSPFKSGSFRDLCL